MLKVNRDNSIKINQGDCFTLKVKTDREVQGNEKLLFYIVDTYNNIILEKQSELYENGLYFVFNTEDTKIETGSYTYYIKLKTDENNFCIITNNVIDIKRGV